jgi:sugar phosphate isomerase/epimerase
MPAPSLSIGAQLYIFSQLPAPDLDALFAGLADAGYAYVEGYPLASPYGREMLERHGMSYRATHAGPRALEPLEPAVHTLTALGGTDFCASGPLDWNRRSAADIRAVIPFLNEKGTELRRRGIRLHYHNHDFEFERMDGVATGMDLLLGGLDPDAVTLCVDIGWVWRMGIDPADFLRRRRDRIGFLHLRDFKGVESVPLGKGDINLRPVIDLLPDLPHLRGVVVEQDPPSDPLGDMIESRQYLRRTFSL